LYIVQGHDHPWLLTPELSAAQVSWVAGAAPGARQLSAKTRYRQADVACDFTPAANGFALRFDIPQWAVTPGQSAVLYDGDVCLGGGIIETASWAGSAYARRPISQCLAEATSGSDASILILRSRPAGRFRRPIRAAELAAAPHFATFNKKTCNRRPHRQ
jgi:hypothetical protein